jgi:hypothetical protein
VFTNGEERLAAGDQIRQSGGCIRCCLRCHLHCLLSLFSMEDVPHPISHS